MNILTLSKKFRRLQTHSARNILTLCKKKDVISFDVFDTLLFRRVDSARDIFRLMEDQLQIPGFAGKRLAANDKIRQPGDSPLPEDFTLREIYDCYEEITDEDRDCFTKLECSLEIEYCEPRPDVKEIFDNCLAMGKTVLLISDMYLPRECITAMLEKCGYREYTALYISGEEGALKLTGNLFRTILKRTGISARSLVHIGDNFVSDFLRPRQQGITAVKIRALTAVEKIKLL